MSGPPAGDAFAARVRSLAQELAAHLRDGAAAEAAGAADALLGLDDTALAAADPATVGELIEPATGLATGGELGRAGELLRKSVLALSGNPRATPIDLVAPLGNLMTVYALQGDGPGCDQVAEQLRGIAERLDEPVPLNAMVVFAQLGAMYRDRGDLDGALVAYRQVHRHMTTLRDSDPGRLVDWLGDYADLLWAGERPEALIEVCRLALSVLERLSPPRPTSVVSFLAGLAGAAAVTEDDATAEEAVRMVEAALGETPPGPAMLAAASSAYHDLGRLRLWSGRAADAVAPLRTAVELSEGLPAERFDRRAAELSDLATAEFETGDLAAASRGYERAVDLRLATLGKGAPAGT